MKTKKLLSVMLSVLMLMTCLSPLTALAASEKKATVSGVKYTYTVNKGKATITGIEFNNYKKKSYTFPSKLGGKTVTEIKYRDKYVGVLGGYSITTVTIPKTVTKIATAPLMTNGTSVKKYSVAKGSKSFTASSSVLFTKNKKTLVAYPAAKKDSSYTIPKTVKTVGSYAFYGNTKIKKVSFPKATATLGAYAFSECTKLKTVDMSKSKIKSIPKSCFFVLNLGTGSLTSVKFSSSTSTIDSLAFSWQFSLKSITLPTSIKKVADQAFYQSGLTTVTVPKKVKSVSFGDGAFVTQYEGVTIVVKDKNTSISCHKNSCVKTIKAPKNSKAAKYAKSHKKDGIKYKELK